MLQTYKNRKFNTRIVLDFQILTSVIGFNIYENILEENRSLTFSTTMQTPNNRYKQSPGRTVKLSLTSNHGKCCPSNFFHIQVNLLHGNN